MFPATLQFIIAMVAYAINERMARRVEYLREEVRVLKEALAAATGKTRIDLTDAQRRGLALRGKALTADERRDCCQNWWCPVRANSCAEPKLQSAR